MIIIFLKYLSLTICGAGLVWGLITGNLLDKNLTRYVFWGASVVPSENCYGSTCLTTPEVNHLHDVRVRLNWLYLVTPIIIGIKLQRSSVTHHVQQVALAVFVFIVLFSTQKFITIFEFMHKILFPGGNWSFVSSSVLIQTYPLIIWFNAVLVIFLISSLCTLFELTNRR